jgi:hypothetical protein
MIHSRSDRLGRLFGGGRFHVLGGHIVAIGKGATFAKAVMYTAYKIETRRPDMSRYTTLGRSHHTTDQAADRGAAMLAGRVAKRYGWEAIKRRAGRWDLCKDGQIVGNVFTGFYLSL